ncbi:hypothetical protein Tco_0223939 [Tanacetum coccineum]
MSTLKFAETHNLVAFLSKPEKSVGFEEIVDFLNSSHIKYALTVNPILYESCIQQFWTTAKAKTVNGERQIQALVDKKKVIITETSIRRDLMLEDVEGTECLPNDVIFEQRTRIGAKTTAWNEFSSNMASAIICLATNQKFNFSKYIFDNMMKNLEGGVKFLMYPRFVQVFLDKQVEGMSKHKKVYVTPSDTKKFFSNMKREGKGFSGNVTPLFATMMVQAYMDEDSAASTDSHPTPIITQPSSSRPQKKQSRRKQRKDSGPTEPITDEATNEEHVPTPSYDLSLSGEDRLKLIKLMEICTNLQKKVLDLETVKDTQALEIEESLGAEEDASKQGRKIIDLDADAKVTLVDKTQGGNNEEDLMFDTGVLDGDEVFVEHVVTTASTTTIATTVFDELTLAKTLIAIKAAKPKAITTAATTVTPVRPTVTPASTPVRPRAKGIVFHDQEEQAPASRPNISSSQLQLPQAKDKGKAKMDEPEIPLKKKDLIAHDKEVARRLEAEMQAELEEEQRVAKQRDEKASLISWDNTQAMIEADFELAQRLQAEEHGELSIEERLKLFVELMNKRKQHFAKLRAEEIRRKPPTKSQRRNQMVTYLKNMAGYKHTQLKNKSFEEIQMLFDNQMKWIDSFVPMDSEVVESSKKDKADTEQESSTKRAAGDELEQEKAKKQKIDDAKEEAEMRKLINIVPDEEEVAIDAIPLATKPPSIVDWKIIKERKVGFYQIIRADGSSKRYSAFIHMIKDFDREDLETLWKLVKAKHGDTRPEEEYERVLWGGSESNERIVGFKRLHDDFEVSAAQASDSPTTPDVAHEVALEIPSEALRETTTTSDTVAKIEETGEFYTSESEEHGTKPEKGKVVLTTMQRRLWDPGIKSAFQDDTLRARWFRRSEECYALSLG